MRLFVLITFDYVCQISWVNHFQIVFQTLFLLKTVEDQSEFVIFEEFSGHNLTFWVLFWRWEKWINSNFKCILDHVRNNSCQKGTSQLKARVIIHLDEPCIKLIVYHEVKSKYLKSELSEVRIEESMHASKGVCCKFLNKILITIMRGYTDA